MSDEVVGTIDLDLKKDKFESYLLNYIANCRSCTPATDNSTIDEFLIG